MGTIFSGVHGSCRGTPMHTLFKAFLIFCGFTFQCTSTPPSRDGISSRSGRVDISDLTWEQKEQCLRLLFAKMNRHKTAATSLQEPTAMPALTAPPTHTKETGSASSLSVFITEQGGGQSGQTQTSLEQVTWTQHFSLSLIHLVLSIPNTHPPCTWR